MFLTLMLVGYATSKISDPRASAAPWHVRLFGKSKTANLPAPNHDDASWNLGAEAWVTISAQAKER